MQSYMSKFTYLGLLKPKIENFKSNQHMLMINSNSTARCQMRNKCSLHYSLPPNLPFLLQCSNHLWQSLHISSIWPYIVFYIWQFLYIWQYILKALRNLYAFTSIDIHKYTCLFLLKIIFIGFIIYILFFNPYLTTHLGHLSLSAQIYLIF